MTEEEHITLDRFQPMLGQAITLRAGEAEWSAELSEVESLPQHNPDGERSPFSLCFKVAEGNLQQGIYQIDHPSLTELTLFLVPIGGDSSNSTLQAIFN